MNNHEQFSRALIAQILDFPALLDDPQVARLSRSDLYGAYPQVLDALRALHADGGVSSARLVEKLPPGLGFDLSFFARLRVECAELPMQDIGDYSDGLKKYAQRKELDGIALEIAQAARTETPPEIVAGQAMDKLARFAIVEQHAPRPLSVIVSEVYDDILARYAAPSEIWGIPFGFPRLDKFTGGWQPNELTILSGDSGLGKTYWATQLAMQAAGTAPGIFFSMEMGEKSIVRRMMKLLGVNGRNIQTGFIGQDEWPLIGDTVDEIAKLPITLESKKYTLHDMRAQIAKLISETGARWGIVDYMMLMEVQARDEIEKTAKISGFLKGVCNDFGFRLLLIHSLNKMGMDNDTPEKSSMRGSGQVTYDSDNIFMLNKFKPDGSNNYEKWIMPADFDKIIRLTIKKGRELDWVGGSALYKRCNTSPKFTELDPDEKPVKLAAPRVKEPELVQREWTD